MGDKQPLPERYAEWLRIASRNVASLERAGNEVVKIAIVSGAFRAWAIKHGHDLDAVGRSKYAVAMHERLQRKRSS